MSKRHDCTVEYTVDGEHEESSELDLTPNEVLNRAGLDPGERYLILVNPDGSQVSFKGRGCEPIRLRDGMKFLSAHCGAVPVS